MCIFGYISLGFTPSFFFFKNFFYELPVSKSVIILDRISLVINFAIIHSATNYYSIGLAQALKMLQVKCLNSCVSFSTAE